MERLTIPDVKIDERRTRRTIIDADAVRENAMQFYWRLKAYEDTGLTPEEIMAAADRRHNCKIECLLEKYNELTDKNAVLREQLAERDKKIARLQINLREQGCEYCQEIKECEFDFGYLIAKFRCNDCPMTDCVRNHKGAKYCRHCGRKLNGEGN